MCKLMARCDLPLLICTLLLMALGVIFIASAGGGGLSEGGETNFARRQLLWVLLGAVALLVGAMVDYRLYWILAPVIYVVNLGLLAMVLVMGQAAHGAQRWLQVGPFPLQPSEPGKILLVLSLAALLARQESRMRGWFWPLAALAVTVPPFLLVVRQPDLGTALVLIAQTLGMLLWAGVSLRKLVAITGGGLAGAIGGLALHMKGWVRLPLQEYQVRRISAFINPDADPLGAGYHIIQSIIAVGSGRWWGTGLFRGTQGQLQFLPARHTDFIFTVIAEETGLAGATAVLALYCFLLYRIVMIAASAPDAYSRIVAGGLGTMFLVQMVVNVGMAMGVMPVTGLPLPFLSYGGSSLLSSCFAIGVILGIRRHARRSRFGS